MARLLARQGAEVRVGSRQKTRSAAVCDAVRSRVVERTGTRPELVKLLGPGTLPRTSSGKLRRGEALRQLVQGELRPPPKVTLLRMAREIALSTAAMARMRLFR